MLKPRSHTFFHFTKEIDTLKSILKNGFWTRYCQEDFEWYNPEINSICYPMVCFCDIPLSRIDEHIDFYGNYGLGLTKKWGFSNELNPVIYLSNKPLKKSLLTLFSQNQNQEYYPNSASDINSILSFIKPVKGNIKKEGKSIEKDFYQENEWRYIPSSPKIQMWISKEDFENEEIKNKFNKSAQEHGSLKFHPNDIKYIFVKSDLDIPNIIDFIQSTFSNYSDNELKILISRIVSLESLNADL